MQPVPAEVWTTLERRLDEARVPNPKLKLLEKKKGWLAFYKQATPTGL